MTITAELHDGRTLEFPDGTDPSVIQATVKRVLQPSAADQIASDYITKAAQNPTEGMSGTELFRTGVGKAFADLGAGFSQLVGSGPSSQQVAETRAQDRPLMKTWPGLMGNVAGNLTALAPAMMIPGANTVAGAGATGALMGALQPTQGWQERAANIGVGGALGAGGQWLGTTGATMMGERAASKEAAARALQLNRTVEDQTLAMGRSAGYKLPPSVVNTSWGTRQLESIGGKAAIAQEVSNQNQDVTIDLARKLASVPPGVPLSKQNIVQARTVLEAPYREVGSLSPMGEEALKAWKQANYNYNRQYKFVNTFGTQGYANPAEIEKLAPLKGMQDLAQQRLEQIAQQAGRPELVPALKQAREAIAKNYDVQRAFNVGSGDVRASYFGQKLARGEPVTGEGEVIGRMQQAYGQFMREGSKVPVPGVSKSKALASALLGTVGYGAGGPAGLLAGALPFADQPVRSLVLSNAYQNAMLKPSYGGAGLLTRIASEIPPEQAGLWGRSLLPALYFGSE